MVKMNQNLIQLLQSRIPDDACARVHGQKMGNGTALLARFLLTFVSETNQSLNDPSDFPTLFFGPQFSQEKRRSVETLSSGRGCLEMLTEPASILSLPAR